MSSTLDDKGDPESQARENAQSRKLAWYFIVASAVCLARVLLDMHCTSFNPAPAVLGAYLTVSLWLWISFRFQPWMLKKPKRAILFGIVYTFFWIFCGFEIHWRTAIKFANRIWP